MPSYQYICEHCGHESVVFQRITAPKLVSCCKCGKDKLVRLIGCPEIIMGGLSCRDSRGELISFPKDGRSYYDRALQKTFHTKKEKRDYMKQNNIAMDGSSDKSTRHRDPTAGDTRKTKPLYI